MQSLKYGTWPNRNSFSVVMAGRMYISAHYKRSLGAIAPQYHQQNNIAVETTQMPPDCTHPKKCFWVQCTSASARKQQSTTTRPYFLEFYKPNTYIHNSINSMLLYQRATQISIRAWSIDAFIEPSQNDRRNSKNVKDQLNLIQILIRQALKAFRATIYQWKPDTIISERPHGTYLLSNSVPFPLWGDEYNLPGWSSALYHSMLYRFL